MSEQPKFRHSWETVSQKEMPSGAQVYKQKHTGPGGRRTLIRMTRKDGGIETRRIDERDFPHIHMYDNPATKNPIWQITTPNGTKRTFDRRSRAYGYLMGWFDNDTPNENQTMKLTRELLEAADIEYNAKQSRSKEMENVRL